MLTRLAILAAVVCGSTAAWADAKEDCQKASGDIANKSWNKVSDQSPLALLVLG